MASLERTPRFPNILLVTGSDVYGGNYRAKLRDFLYSCAASSSPVRQGTHDFWVTYAEPELGGGDWGLEDLSKTPRKMRGIVRMGALPQDLAQVTVRDQMSVMLQEVGHHWLVPTDLKFNIGSSLAPMPTERQAVEAINNEASFIGPPLLARGNIHWSAFWQADASPMDGLYFVRQGEEDGYATWRADNFQGATLQPSGLQPVQMRASYNDLDRVVMGTKSLSAAYASSGGVFRWFEPRLSAPHPYHAGLFVAFSRFDFMYFGFFEDHRRLGVQRTGGPVVTAELGPGYRPLADDFNAVALRIVRRGDTYHFQARYDNPPHGPVTPKLDDDLEDLPAVQRNPVFNATKFRTISTLKEVRQRPEAIGVLVKKRDHPHLAELTFQDLAIFEPGSSRLLTTKRVPGAFRAGLPFSQLPRDSLRVHRPVTGPIVRAKRGRLHILAPFHTVDQSGTLTEHNDFNHSADVDRAPKVLVRAPEGDFAVATSAKIWRTIYTPWAGGYARERTVWAKEKSLAASSTVVPSGIVTEKQPPPPDDTYKVAFIVVAENRSDITDQMIERADALRRYWDEAFDSSTEGQRHSDSTLGASTLEPALWLSTRRIRFGTTPVGVIKNSSFRFRNDAACTLSVRVPAPPSGHFSWEVLDISLAPGEDRVVAVQFDPTSEGSHVGRLQVESDDPDSPHSVELRGTATPAA